jgi:hypothetical protein
VSGGCGSKALARNAEYELLGAAAMIFFCRMPIIQFWAAPHNLCDTAAQPRRAGQVMSARSVVQIALAAVPAIRRVPAANGSARAGSDA